MNIEVPHNDCLANPVNLRKPTNLLAKSTHPLGDNF